MVKERKKKREKKRGREGEKRIGGRRGIKERLEFMPKFETRGQMTLGSHF